MTGEVIGPSSPKQEMMLNTETDVAIWGGAMGCLPAEAEVLTVAGWIQIQDYGKLQDIDGNYLEIATPSKSGITFEYPSKFIKLPCSSFYKLEDTLSDRYFIYSLEHDFVNYDQSGKEIKSPVWEIVETISYRGKWEGYVKILDSTFNQKLIKVAFDQTCVAIVDRPDQLKYCFKTNSGKFFVRFGEDIYITGNSGKSYMALLYPLKYVDDPHFRGIIFRKTRTELKASGGLWELANDIYTRIFGLENLGIWQNELKIRFPLGATLKFSFLESDSDCLTHQGAQYTFVLYDKYCRVA